MRGRLVRGGGGGSEHSGPQVFDPGRGGASEDKDFNFIGVGLRQLSFIQVLTVFIPLWKLFFADVGASVRERISWVFLV